MEKPEQEPIIHPSIKAIRTEWELRDTEEAIAAAEDPEKKRRLAKERMFLERDLEKAGEEEAAWKAQLPKLIGKPESQESGS